MVDILGGSTTTTTIAIGGSITDSLEVVGDHDWVKIQLTAGQSISVLLDGLTLEDPYLRIRDASGNVLFENDDIVSGTNRDAQIAFTANYTGAYFIDVGAWDEKYVGSYKLSVSPYASPPVGTVQQMANQLVNGYWGGDSHHFAVSQGGTITVNITGLTAAGQGLARAALAQWTDVIGVNFAEVATGGQISFDDNEEGAHASAVYSNGITSSAQVNVSTQWLANYGSGLTSYAYQAYIHEIGHALGLGHGGNYNETARFPFDAQFQNDAWPLTIMSYFDQSENNYFADLGFTKNFVTTPMMADIYAMSLLYGLSTTTRSGDTVYGPGWGADMGALCLFDSGGTDTIDVAAYGGDQKVDLNPGTFSNVVGEVGNVSIALNVIIENARSGGGRDHLRGNDAANLLDSGGNNDLVEGGAGNDTLTGGAGIDTLTGGSGSDIFRDTTSNLNGDTITDFATGDRIVIANASLATFTFSLSNGRLSYNGGELVLTGVTGTLAASAAAGGGVELRLATSAATAGDARNDFNGDGRSDILWRHDDGRMTDWLGAANGGFLDNAGNALTGVPVQWRVAGSGDFNGDGRDDILWRHDDGRLTDWLGAANGGFVDNAANASTFVPTQWKVAGTGDFNGDGRDDILWRHDDGRMTDWLGATNGGFFDNAANALTGVPTAWGIAGTGDFNGDGRDDILWRNVNGMMSEWLGATNGGFIDNVANASTFVPTHWNVAGTGDFNGDGRDDILWRNDDGRITNWLGLANGGFRDNAANGSTGVPTAWDVASVGDYNGDGRDDILWRHDDGRLTDWLGATNGGFFDNAANASTSAPTAWHVQSNDLFLV